MAESDPRWRADPRPYQWLINESLHGWRIEAVWPEPKRQSIWRRIAQWILAHTEENGE